MENNAPKIEVVTVRLPEGTGSRIDKVLYGGELRSAFIREAIEAELQRRKPSRRRRRVKDDRDLDLTAAY